MKKKIESFENLFIWQKGIVFVKEIYLITEKKGLKNDFGLKNQILMLLFQFRLTLPKDLNVVRARNT